MLDRERKALGRSLSLCCLLLVGLVAGPALGVAIAPPGDVLPGAAVDSPAGASDAAGGEEGGSIAGQVRSGFDPAESVPLPDAQVWLFRVMHHRMEFVAGTISGDEGHYGFCPLPPGRYSLVASAPEHVPGGAIARLRPGHDIERIILLRPAGPPPEFGAVAGHVFGVVPDGKVPLGGALVRLFHNGHVVRETVTGNDGGYFIGEVPAGFYGIVAVAQGFAPQGAEIVVDPGEVTEQNFLLEPGGPPAHGACCVENGCLMLTEEHCLAEGGEYQGDDSMCMDHPCGPPPVVGACCIGNMCHMLPEEHCLAEGGEYQGDDSTGMDHPCGPPPVVGACCIGNMCVMLPEELCLAGGGEYQGDDSTCKDHPCMP